MKKEVRVGGVLRRRVTDKKLIPDYQLLFDLALQAVSSVINQDTNLIYSADRTTKTEVFTHQQTQMNINLTLKV